MNKSRKFLKIHYVLMQEPIVQIWQFTKKSNPHNVVTLGHFIFSEKKKKRLFVHLLALAFFCGSPETLNPPNSTPWCVHFETLGLLPKRFSTS
jgi:hypothetical protein